MRYLSPILHRRAAAVALALVLVGGGCSDDAGASVDAVGAATDAEGGTTVLGDEGFAPAPEEDGLVAATSAPVSPVTATTGPPEVTRTLAFGGDLLTHGPVNSAAAARGAPYDFGALLAPLAPVVGAVDLALCHLEVPLVGDGQQISGYPSFHAPRELAAGVQATGYDGCSTASNHSLDGGLPAIRATLDTFDALGLGHVGTARTAEEDVAPRIYDLDGVAIAHLSYAYGFNGYQPPADAPWAVDAIDPAVVARDAAAARAAGAVFVVVSLHWGDEYVHEPSGYQVDIADQVTAIGDVDLVIGHHAHVVQPATVVNGTWVVFGLGNQLSAQAEDERRDGLVVVVTVAGPEGGRLAVRGIDAVPTFVDTNAYEVLPTALTLARTDLDPGLRAAVQASQDRTMATLTSAGAAILLQPPG